MSENWTAPTDAYGHFRQEQKRQALDQRRPVIRQASDLVGPGIGSEAVRISNFNDLLATFNGYYSAVAGTPNAPTATEAFIGQTFSDATLGGRQSFTGLTTNTEYTRTFKRNPSDPESLVWSEWSGQRVVAAGQGYLIKSILVNPDTQTELEPPDLTYTPGASAYFDRFGKGIRIKKQGVYTGHIQVGGNSITAAANVNIILPDGDGLNQVSHINVLLGPTSYYPFTFWAHNGLRSISVSILHVTPGTNNKFWYRMSIARLGDAF